MGFTTIEQAPVGGHGLFNEVHYTVTTPETPANMGGHGVHITLVTDEKFTYGSKKGQDRKVHVYYHVESRGLRWTKTTPKDLRHVHMAARKLPEWRTLYEPNALKAFEKHYPPATAKAGPATFSNSDFPALSSATTSVALPAMASASSLAKPGAQTVVNLRLPGQLVTDLPPVVESVLLACGAFDDD